MINIAYEFGLNYRPAPGHRAWRPLVALRISAGQKYVDTVALVDSGADYSVFFADVAEALGLQLTNGRRTELEGLDGNKYVGYLHYVALRILEAPPSWPPIRVEVIFRENHPKTLGNLLGRHDFFRVIKLGFDERNQRFYLGQA